MMAYAPTAYYLPHRFSLSRSPLILFPLSSIFFLSFVPVSSFPLLVVLSFLLVCSLLPLLTLLYPTLVMPPPSIFTTDALAVVSDHYAHGMDKTSSPLFSACMTRVQELMGEAAPSVKQMRVTDVKLFVAHRAKTSKHFIKFPSPINFILPSIFVKVSVFG